MNRIYQLGAFLTALALSVSTSSCSRALADEDKKAPVGWIVAGSSPADYEMTSDSQNAHSGKESGHIHSLEHPEGFGTLMQRFDPERFRGKRLRLSAFVKSSNVKDWAGLWMRIDGPEQGKSLAFDNMQRRAIKGTSDWTRYEIVLDVPNEATLIAFGALLTGPGDIWIDDAVFDEVDDSVPATDLIQKNIVAKEPLNLGFEQ